MPKNGTNPYWESASSYLIRSVVAEAVFASLLGGVHGTVGARHQRGDVVAVVGVQRCAHAGGYLHPCAIQVKGQRQHVQNLVGYLRAVVRSVGGGQHEAELVAARLGASKGGFFEEEDGSETPSDWQDSVTQQPVREVQPGQFDVLPAGVKFKEYNPTHPNANFGAFLKAVLRGAAAGLGVSYNGLARDLEGVNYSSLRGGELDERDYWCVLQQWLVEELCEPAYSSWLDMSLLTGALALPPSKRDKFDADVWHARGWPWVDPSKDIDAAAGEIELGINSLTRIAAARGVDLEDVFRERRREIDLAKQYGVELGLPKRQPQPPQQPQPTGTGQNE